MRFVLFSLMALGALTAHARDLTQREKLNDLNQLLATIEGGYGPLEYKAQKLGVTTDGIRAKYEPLIRDSKSNRDFYYTIVKLIAEFRDGHFGASVPTQQTATLPIFTDLVEGKVLIDDVKREQLPESSFPYRKGDEIVSVDGRPALEVVADLEQYVAMANLATRKRVAAMALLRRSGTRYPVPAPGKVKLEIRRGSSAFTDTIELEWKISGEAFDEALPEAPKPSLLFSAPRAKSMEQALQLSARDVFEQNLERETAERSYSCSGKTRIEIPAGATMLMEEPFVAYYFPTAKGNLGYLRIPHYYPQDELTGKFLYEETFQQYKWAVKQLEKNTVGLIIDQDHNCGGSVSYLERIVSLFADKPFKGMEFQFRASKPEYLSFKGYAKETTANTIDHDNILIVADLIKKAWEAGQWLSEKTTFNGGMLLSPDADVRYTKPIVMLIDEMSGSGGDGFPSLMQGYGRAKLIGSATMGLGGHVEEQPDLAASGVKYRMTRSLFFRPDGVPVENNGAVPDYPYTITRDDFMYGYRAYRDFAISKVLEMVK